MPFVACLSSALNVAAQPGIGNLYVPLSNSSRGLFKRMALLVLFAAGDVCAAEPQVTFALKAGFVDFTIRQDGKPVADAIVEVTAGQVHDSTRVESVLDQVAIPQRLGRPRKRPLRLAGDKGYSYPRVRNWLRAHGIKPVIPHKDNEHARYDGRVKFDKESYKRRSIVEQTIGWLKECRRIGTRFEKLAINFLAMMKLAMIQRCLKILFSDRA